MTDDLLVVGGGLAGCVAALAAARERPGARVRLLVTADDRFDDHPGTIDVLGYLPEAADTDVEAPGAPDSETAVGPVENPLAAVDALPATHPYRRLGRDRLAAALALFDDAVGYRGDHTERNALVATHAGRVRPTARYPAGMAGGLASRDEPMCLVGFESLPDFDAPLVADRLDDTLPYEVTGVTVEFPGTVTEFPSGPVLAAALDDDEPPSGDVGMPEVTADEGLPPGLAGGDSTDGPPREKLVERMLPELGTEGRVGVPAVLGEREHEAVREHIETAVYADVFEIPVGPPSVPGRRLEARLHGALAGAGVAVERVDHPEFETSGGRIDRVSLPDGEHAVESVVLATGGLGGPGLVADEAGVHEPVFGCHVDHPDDREAWTAPEFLGDHAFARFGVSVDDALRPVDADGHPEYENLRAAGRVLGGVDCEVEQSGDGVALVTGYAAGRFALP